MRVQCLQPSLLAEEIPALCPAAEFKGLGYRRISPGVPLLWMAQPLRNSCRFFLHCCRFFLVSIELSCGFINRLLKVDNTRPILHSGKSCSTIAPRCKPCDYSWPPLSSSPHSAMVTHVKDPLCTVFSFPAHSCEAHTGLLSFALTLPGEVSGFSAIWTNCHGLCLELTAASGTPGFLGALE